MRPKKVFTKEQLVQGMRDKAFKNVTFMTGAGISVAAGIPDFRTPGIGLYAKAAILGLPYPEAVFCLDYLRERPSAFYNIANGFLTFKAKPVKAHHFIKRFSDEGLLQMNYTQNIDGLELEAGLSLEKLVQAHGHMRTAGCIDCGKPSDIDDFFAHVAKETVQYCLECNGIIKPDIVFFGESLPAKFAEQFHQIGRSDLVFVMGTSLKVYPFASLLTALAPGTPVVLLNRENPGINMDHLLFLPGAIEDSVAMLAEEFGWGDLAMGTTDEQAGEKEASVEVTAKFSVFNI
jgi:NAD-dependent SIR2 family protein deacetylase